VSAIDPATLSFPADLHYLVEHDVWARLEPDGTATVGITALGIKLSGEIYMCRVKSKGSVIEQGRAVAVVELAKAIVSVKCAVSGEVVAVNPLLEEAPELVHRDPYGDGWLARLALKDFESDRQQLVRGADVPAAMVQHAQAMGQRP
jgi:glycine cleavage system H protein